MLINLPHIDRKAALLAGYEVGPNPTVEVNLAELGEYRVPLIEAMTMHQDGSATLPWTVTAPTVEALITAASGRAQADIDAKAAHQRKYEELLARMASAAVEIAGMVPEGAAEIGVYEPDGILYLGKIDGFREPLYPYCDPHALWTIEHRNAALNSPEFAAYNKAKEALKARVAAANAEARDAARPALRIARAEQLEAARLKKIADDAAKAEKLAATANTRLSTGYWERETPAYNSRREGKPWCANVTGVDGRGKLIYEWAEWTGRMGEAGLLRAPCKPGDIVAWGQRDLKRGDRSDHTILRMQENGTMVELTAAQAAKILRGEG